MQLLKPHLNQLYCHLGPPEEVAAAFAQLSTQQLTGGSYEVLARYSFGTMQGSAWPGKGIYVTATLTAETPTYQEIRFTTSVRPEHYMMAVMSFITTVASFYSHDWEIILFMFFIWPVFFLWFQIIYRSQEQELVNGLVQRLRLKLLSPVR